MGAVLASIWMESSFLSAVLGVTSLWALRLKRHSAYVGAIGLILEPLAW